MSTDATIRAVVGGTVVNATGQLEADILIVDGRIAIVGNLGDTHVDEVIDAAGLFVLPGAIDPHTHIAGTFRSRETSDDFRSATTAAACGGTTCVMDFCFPKPGMSLQASLAAWRDELDAAQPVVDVGVHAVLVNPSEDDLLELPDVRGTGVTSVKLFLAYKGRTMSSDDRLFRAMQTAAANQMIVMVHAENGEVIDVLVRQALAAGHIAPVWHARTRPTAIEGEAVNRAIELAKLARCHLYVVHVTCDEALAPIRNARAGAGAVWGETCPQYLVLDESRLGGSSEKAARFVCSPPLREPTEHDGLWKALARDELSVLASDHCPFDLHKKWPASDFSQIVSGLPGVEQRLVLGHHFGVRAGYFDMCRLAEVTSTNPARLFGLYPRKGTIAPGADADLVLFDSDRRLLITAARHNSRVDHLPYEGIEVVGAPRIVLVRGEPVVADGEPLGHYPGRYVHRATQH